jgi:hypothetical protein
VKHLGVAGVDLDVELRGIACIPTKSAASTPDSRNSVYSV